MVVPSRSAQAARFVGSHLTWVGADYTDDEREFMIAMDRYKRTRNRPYPTWREVLAVLVSLGYSKQGGAGPLPGERAQRG